MSRFRLFHAQVLLVRQRSQAPLLFTGQEMTKYDAIRPQSIRRETRSASRVLEPPMGSIDVRAQTTRSEFTWWQYTNKIRVVSSQRDIHFETAVWRYCQQVMFNSWYVYVIFQVMTCLCFSWIFYYRSFTVDTAVKGLDVYTIGGRCQTTDLFPGIYYLAWMGPVAGMTHKMLVPAYTVISNS